MNGLVAWANALLGLGCGYVYGSQGEIMTEDRLEELINTYSKKHYYFSGYNANKWIGNRCFDCSGLVVWILQQLKIINENQDYTADELTKLCTMISKQELIPGDLVFVVSKTGIAGHVGIYVGEGHVIQSRGTKYGVVKTSFEEYNYWNTFGRLTLNIPDNINWCDPIYEILQENNCDFSEKNFNKTLTRAEMFAILFRFGAATGLIK